MINASNTLTKNFIYVFRFLATFARRLLKISLQKL